jgi:hypothetical protein
MGEKIAIVAAARGFLQAIYYRGDRTFFYGISSNGLY